MKRNKIIVALSLIACTLLSCQKEKEQPSSLSNESKNEGRAVQVECMVFGRYRIQPDKE